VQTVKTALVVVALLAALFVAYRVVNQQPIGLPFDLAASPPFSPDSAFDAAAGISVETPGAPGPAWPSAAPGENAFPAPPAGLSPPAFAIAPPTAEGLSPSPLSDPSSFAQQASQVAPVTAELPSSANLSTSPLDAPLRPAPAFEPSENSSGGDSAANVRQPPSSQSADATTAPGAGSARETTAAIARYSFEQAWQKADQQIAEGYLARALLTLSEFYRHPGLDEAAQSRLNERLDQLAGTVIYSKRHLLEEAYDAHRGDTLHDLAARYHVSPKLLQNINGVADPSIVLPGSELKLVRGPFRAEIDLARGEATMFLGGLYAGRFPVRAGRDPSPKPGEYQVVAIEPGRSYYLPSGQMIAPGAATNPYGQWWIDLGNEQSLHGSPDAGAEANAGCLSLSPRDAADVAAILTVGSKVVIK
jgi:hypothetical protein